MKQFKLTVTEAQLAQIKAAFPEMKDNAILAHFIVADKVDK
jgi:hypothetical protein